MKLEPLNKKWSSFGWDTDEVDGHDVDKMYEIFTKKNSTPYVDAKIAISKDFYTIKNLIINL